MAREDTPGVQRAISETTPLRVGIGRAFAAAASLVLATISATAFALNLQFSVSDLKKAGEVQAEAAKAQAAEMRELRASVGELREWARRLDRRFDRSSDVTGSPSSNTYQGVP